jgi:hypothetical protein
VAAGGWRASAHPSWAQVEGVRRYAPPPGWVVGYAPLLSLLLVCMTEAICSAPALPLLPRTRSRLLAGDAPSPPLRGGSWDVRRCWLVRGWARAGGTCGATSPSPTAALARGTPLATPRHVGAQAAAARSAGWRQRSGTHAAGHSHGRRWILTGLPGSAPRLGGGGSSFCLASEFSPCPRPAPCACGLGFWLAPRSGTLRAGRVAHARAPDTRGFRDEKVVTTW